MPDIRLIAIDLDDTLLLDDLTISCRARKAISKAVEKGIHVTLATGRMYRSALPFALDLQLNLPLITYQGALVKYSDGREVYHRPIEIDTARELVCLLMPYGHHVNIYIDDELYMSKDSPEGQRYLKIARVPVHLAEELQDVLVRRPSKIVVIASSPELDRLAVDAREFFGESLNITKSKPTFLEFAHPQATKGLALEYLANSLGISSGNVMAIGDSPNDLDMLEYAGWGVAMGNADSEVKARARYITCSNNDDGVAEAIEKFVL